MAQFIQSDRMAPIQGSAGDQSPVIDQGPTLAEGVAQVGSTIDTLGSIYSNNKAKSLATEEIENIDAAIARAESGEFAPGDDVPESIKLDQKEWDILSTAVINGEMSREKARLIASSRLRTRISEEPFFADRMRRAASGVLGFNIESEAAQQYFASLPTEAGLAQQRGSDQNKKIIEMQQFAEEESRLTGIPADKIYRQMWQLEAAERNKEMAINRREAGLASDQETFTEFNRENARTAFTGVMGNLKTIYDQEGSVKPEVYNQALSDAKAQELQELSQVWQGDQTAAEYARAQAVIENRYDSYRSILEAVDYDKLNKIIIDRNANERAIFTDQMFSDVKMINDVAGQEGVKAYFDSMSPRYNETQRRQLFEQFPILKRLHSLQNASPGELADRLNTTSRKMITGEPFDEQDEEVLDVAAAQLHDKAEDNSIKTKVFDRLAKDGKKYKAISIAVKASPNVTSSENIANVRRAYQEEMPDMIKTVSRQVAALGQDVNDLGEPAVKLEMDNKGNFVVESLRPLSLPQGKLNELRNTVAKINQFNKAHNNNWSAELGESKQDYVVKARQFMEEGQRMGLAEINATQQDSFAKAVNAGAENRARELYEQMRESNPDVFTSDFETIFNEIRRRRVEQAEAQRRGE